jgi:predicted nucleotide-binding protein (sugar kinase/HSP70/actin superfamily)
MNAVINCNTDFMEIYTLSSCNVSHRDPLGDDFYFSLNEQLDALGDALVSALKKSRDLSSTPEERKEFTENAPDTMSGKLREWYDSYHKKWLNNNPGRLLFEKELVEKREQEWIEHLLKNYGYKSRRALFKNMQSCFVAMEEGVITFSPAEHDKLDGWGSTTKSYKFSIPSSSPKIIGAAVKYSVGRCTGKGADLVAKKLFPDGVPDTFDDFLKLLNL